MTIKKLSEKLIKQIAAGEVVARPANAIKELIENSIDAHASEINIYIEKNALESIVIIDNGCGMDADDLAIAAQLHTTSKTQENDHMFGTKSFGFRGEALASISAISNMIIESNGKKWIATNDALLPSHIKKGTRIEVTNMFSNTPARLKFLKSSQSEWSAIKLLLEKFIIKETKIAWQVFHNGKKIWHIPHDASATERIAILLNSDFHAFAHEYNNIKINGFILDISARNFAALYINNRLVQDKAIANYMRNIFSEYYMKNENPGYILNIEIDPMLVDCNVHPAKAEVRIVDYSHVFAMLSFVLNPAFFKKVLQKEHIRDDKAHHDTTVQETTTYQEPQFNFEYKQSASHFVNEAQTEYKSFQEHTLKAVKPIEIGTPTQAYKIIGQIKNSFIIFETENVIGIFDQHAAHERHIYEKMKCELTAGNSQQLIIPLELILTSEQAEYLQQNEKKLSIYGIKIDASKLTHIPQTLPATDFKNFIENNLNEHSEIDILIDRLVADIACKNALKANTALSFSQMSSLLETALNNIPICNHGRPVFKYFTHYEIETWFRRK